MVAVLVAMEEARKEEPLYAGAHARKARFVKPTVEEIAAYCRSRNNGPLGCTDILAIPFFAKLSSRRKTPLSPGEPLQLSVSHKA